MVNRNNILLVGTGFKHANADWEDYYTKKHFSDYQIVILDPHGAFEGQSHSYRVVDNILILDEDNGPRFEKQFLNITGKLASFVNEGGMAIVFCRYLPMLQYKYWNRTGYQTKSINLNHAFPWKDNSIIEGHGKSVEISAGVRGGAYEQFWGASGDVWRYEGYFTKDVADPIAHVIGRPDHVVAFSIITTGNGHILTTPIADFDWIEEPGKGAAIGAFLEEVTTLEVILSAPSEKVELPEWTEKYQIPGEAEAIVNLDDTKAEIDRLQVVIKNSNKDLAELQKFKILFSGYDSPLERMVEKVLTELGMQVTPGKKGRVDWVAEYDDKIFAVEIQGVKKSAKEDHARSLTQWVQEVAIEKGNEPKGLFIVNAYRDTELAERGDNPWVGKIPEICERQEFCALTGLQLLNIYFDIREHPEKKDEIIYKLFNTVGPYEGNGNWASFIAHSPEIEGALIDDNSDGSES